MTHAQSAFMSRRRAKLPQFSRHFDGTNPEEGSGLTHWAGSMLCHSKRIKQGFRLAQTLVYTIDCDTALAYIQSGRTGYYGKLPGPSSTRGGQR